MVRYDGGWGRSPESFRYDHPYRPFRTYGPPAPEMRPGGPASRGYEPDFGGGEPEEFWEPGTVYGPARYGLGPYHERLRRQRRSDAELKEEVEEALFYDTWVDADAIAVEVSDGVVTLRGELPDFEEIRYATDDAWDVDGVRGVRSELSIRQGGGRSQPQGAGSGGGATASAEAAPAKRTRKKPSAP